MVWKQDIPKLICAEHSLPVLIKRVCNELWVEGYIGEAVAVLDTTHNARPVKNIEIPRYELPLVTNELSI